ncbi:MAG: hypothetical protein ACLR0N_00365 [Bilophila wadsworthia]
MSNPIHSTSAKSVLPMLAMRGLATGLCAGCVVGLLRLSHDRAAARVALWLEEWRRYGGRYRSGSAYWLRWP